MRVAFIGAGDVVHRSYLPAISQRSDCKIVAICSQSGQSARELADIYEIETVSKHYQELLRRQDIDIVFICTPTYLHREIAEAAMKHEKHILVEKPLCVTYQDSRALLQQAIQYSKTFYVSFNNQFRVENQWLKAKVLAGDVGDLELIDLAWYRTKRHADKMWLYTPNLSGGGVLVDLGAHLIHFALSLIPERRQFTAYCHNLNHQSFSAAVEDTSVAMITVDHKVTILIKLGWDMHLSKPSKVTFEVFGRTGNFSNQDYAASQTGSQQAKTSGFEPMIQDFFQHIEANTKPDLGLVDDTMKLLNILYQSNAKQTTLSGEFCTLGD